MLDCASRTRTRRKGMLAPIMLALHSTLPQMKRSTFSSRIL